MEEKKRPNLFVPDHPVTKAMLEWWGGMEQKKGDRAELKRCKSLAEIQTSSAFQRCYWQLVDHFKQGDYAPAKEQMAIIVGLAAHVEENDMDRKNDQDKQQQQDFFAYQIGRGENGPALSELRFRKMLKIKNREKLYRFLIQVIRMLEKKVNLIDLQSIAFFWGDAVKRDLAYKYYEKAKLENNA